MKRDDWRRAYEPLPASLEHRVSSTLRQIEEGKPMKKLTIRTASLVMALVLVLAGTAWALENWGVTDFLKEDYGETLSPEATGLIKSDFSDASLQAGDVTFTLREMIADAYVGMAVVECKAPEGKYLYSDMVQMTNEEWEMTEADRFAKYGDYYWLNDTHVAFGEEEMYEYAMDGVRESDNVILMQVTFPVGEKVNVADLTIDVAARHVTGDDMAAAERIGGSIIPGYTADASAYKAFTKEVNDGTIKDAVITVTPLLMHAKVTLENANEEPCTLLITDKDGAEMEFTYLASFGQSFDGTILTNACGLPETLPESVFVQAAQFDPETGDPVAMGERVEIMLK